ANYVSGFQETQAEMCVPLIFFGEKLGVLALESRIKNSFDPADIGPLESMGDICAAAIQNAKHFQSTRQLAYLDGLTGVFNRRFFEMRIVEKVRKNVENWIFPGVPRKVTISAGVADCPTQGITRDEVVAAADAALYLAKQSGRNRVCSADANFNKRASANVK